MKQNLFMTLSAVCLLAACSSSDELQAGEENEVINATATLSGSIDSPVSRVAVDGLPTGVNTLAVAFARLDEESAGTYPAAGYTAVTAASPATINNAGKVAFSPALYYLTNKDVDETKLVGWYPAGTYTAGTVTFAIDGKTDVMLSNEKAGSLSGKFGTNDFTFSHQLAQFVVKAYAADATSAGASGKWGKIVKMEFLNQPGECKITLPATVTTTGNASITLKNADADMAEVTLAESTAALAATCGYAILAPTTGNKTVKLKVTTSTGIEQTVDVSLNTAAEYVKGMKYTVVLKFSVAGIEPEGTTITPWTDATENPGDITM